AGSPLVFQSDFGLRDSAVASMKGVAVGVSPELGIYDLTHEIPVFNIWEASLRLIQAADYWPKGTVFVSVVDPGVGTVRKSVVLLTKSGHYFVTPDNGTLTFVAEELGLEAVREIDEAVNRLANSEESYTFHGRDVYAYTGARLASGTITFEQVGRLLPPRVVSIDYQKPAIDSGVIRGNIPILDIQYGNVWTNIDRATFRGLGVEPGDQFDVSITYDDTTVFEGRLAYFPTFGYVEVGEPIIYLNSLGNISLAINQGSFANTHGIASGANWSIQVKKPTVEAK
ncbi:MAG: S-adenosyl-l-methionine hydroxide adenosyltransferase family protein, partial [Gammaproteobacteria bacterium]|nr:S-adenosyl-l-methionine hydroxide adenosyltransferase family protein [Gammaproteobacteria bacterium]